MANVDLIEKAYSTGYLVEHFTGVQININAAPQVFRRASGASGQVIELVRDKSACDHNCGRETLFRGTLYEGGYDCGSGMLLPSNKGIEQTKLASPEMIVAGIRRAVEGARLFNSEFLLPRMGDYYNEWRVPDTIRMEHERILNGNLAQVNIFGGNPEQHDGVGEIVRQLKQGGGKIDYLVSFTTTGQRFMKELDFCKRIIEFGVDLIALSADDFESPEDIYRLAKMSLEEKVARHQDISPALGQRRKAVEAIATAVDRAKEFAGFPPILFNMVLHSGNLDQTKEMMLALHEVAPNVKINPFLAQSSFERGKPIFGPADVAKIERFVDRRLDDHVASPQPNWLTPRIQYWLALKAGLITYKDEETELISLLSGNNFWQCYRPDAGKYIQIGLGLDPYKRGSREPGGWLNCYWNNFTVFDSREQVKNLSPFQVAEYLNGGMTRLYEEAKAGNILPWCMGCGMPRLMDDGRTTELGLNEKLADNYLDLRHEYLGF